MARYLTHITQAGERWDLIAWAYYRDVAQIPALIEANPHLPIAEKFPGGLKVLIPIIEPREANLENLPPWKR
jgi:phage tail protein X